MDDLNAQRRASGKLPYSTGTEFVVNKFRMHFFHGSDLHDGTGVEDNFVLLLSLQSLAGGNFLGGTRRSDHVTVQVARNQRADAEPAGIITFVPRLCCAVRRRRIKQEYVALTQRDVDSLGSTGRKIETASTHVLAVCPGLSTCALTGRSHRLVIRTPRASDHKRKTSRRCAGGPRWSAPRASCG